MAVIDQDNFSNISWNSDQRTDDEGVSASHPGDNNNTSTDSNNTNINGNSRGTKPRMSDDNDFEQPLSPGGESRQKQKQKQKQSGGGGGGAAGGVGGSIDYESHDASALGPEILQCRVFSPLTENEGGSNPFTSYLVSTTVCITAFHTYTHIHPLSLILLTPPVHLPLISKTHGLGPPSVHRLPIPLQLVVQGLPRLRRAADPRQATHGPCHG